MLRAILANELRKIADRIDSGTCDITEDDALEIMEAVGNVSISKAEAAQRLNMPVSTFDKQVASGRLPQLHKRKGITERLWYLKDIIFAIHKRV